MTTKDLREAAARIIGDAVPQPFDVFVTRAEGSETYVASVSHRTGRDAGVEITAVGEGPTIEAALAASCANVTRLAVLSASVPEPTIEWSDRFSVKDEE